MTSDLDIMRTAWVLIRQHGEDAALHAAEKADAFLERGNMDGKRMWLRILRAIEELQRTEPNDGERRH